MNDQIEFMMKFQYILFYFVRPAIYLAIAVFGFIILFSKTKSTRILGLSFVLTSFASLLECASTLIARFSGADAYFNFVLANNIIQMVITIATPLCMCIFIHRNYGKKLIYIPLLILPVLNIVARIAINVAFNSLGMSGQDMLMWSNTVNAIDSFVIGAAVTVILIIIFYKNRKTEKIIPLAWIFEIVNLVWSAVFSFCLCISYQTMYQGKTASDFSNSIGITALFLQAVISMVFPVYVMIMAVKKGKLEST
ncbi:MAG: hypothetical protein J6U23_11455 [Clostridiales bacterium]|nr:hypothetical protein [Clostridiales bacterium]